MFKKILLGLLLSLITVSAYAQSTVSTYSNIGSVTASANDRQQLFPTRTIISGTLDTVSQGDSVIFWNSSTSSAKTQTLPACTTLLSNSQYAIYDEAGSAASYNITLAVTGGKINNGSTYTISTNGQLVTLVCDASNGNWVVGAAGSGGGGSPSIGGTITGGTAGSVLFVNPTATIAQDNTQLNWNDSTYTLSLGSSQYSDTGVAIGLWGNTNGYYQHIISNASTGTSASADFIVSNNSATSSTYYGDFGINGSNFSGTGSFSLPSATYLYAQSGDLSLGTYGSNAIHFVVNNGATDAASISTGGVLTTNNGIVTPNVNSGQLAGLRNMLINGDFRLSTYAVPAYTSNLTLTTTLKMVIERWFAYAPAGSPTCTQTAGSDGQHQFVYQCTGAASTTGIYIGQRILATNSSYVAGKSVTLGIDLADSTLTSATCALSYANSTNTWGSVASPTVTAIGSQTFTISSTLTRYNYTFTVPSAATTGLQLLCNVGAQTSGTFTVGNVQLEIGTQATPFERIPQGLEYMQASTYHVELSGYANLYGTCSTYANLGTAVLYSTTNGNGTIPIPTQMWKSPTITTAGTFQFENSTDPAITSFSVDDQMGAQLNVDIVTATSTSGTLGIMRWNNTACTTQRFTIEAETTL